MAQLITTELDKNLILLMAEYGKIMKSTLTVIYNYSIFGFNGEMMNDGLMDIACVKFTDDANIDSPTCDQNKLKPAIQYCENHHNSFAIMTKDFNPIFKELKLNPDSKVFVTGYYSNGLLVGNEMRMNIGDLVIPVYSSEQYIWAHQMFIIRLSIENRITVFRKDITDDPQFQKMISKKASYGGMFINVDGYREYMNSSIVNMNKGDRVLCSIYDYGNTSLVDIITVKPKKKCELHSVSVMLNMR